MSPEVSLTRRRPPNLGANSDNLPRTGPPVGWLAVAAGLLALAAPLVFVDAFGWPNAFGWHLAGYLLAAVGAVSLLSLFHRIDQTRRLMLYTPRRHVAAASAALAVTAVLVASGHCWSIAIEVAR